MNEITLTLHEFRNLIETDDSLEAQRAWLIRNTAAAGECTVIQPHHAAAIQAADPDLPRGIRSRGLSPKNGADSTRSRIPRGAPNTTRGSAAMTSAASSRA